MNKNRVTQRELAMHIVLAYERRGLQIDEPEIAAVEAGGAWRILSVSGEHSLRYRETADAVEMELGKLYALTEAPSRVPVGTSARSPLNYRKTSSSRFPG